MPFNAWLALVEHHHPILFLCVEIGLTLAALLLVAWAFFSWLDHMEALV